MSGEPTNSSPFASNLWQGLVPANGQVHRRCGHLGHENGHFRVLRHKVSQEYTHTHTNSLTHTHIHTHTYTYTHTHTNTHTHTHRESVKRKGVHFGFCFIAVV